jgi:hypothetical protein
MSLITIPYTFTPFTTAYSAQVNSNFSTIATAINGNLDNTNIGSAGIYASQIIPTNSTQATFGGSVSYTMTTAPIFSSLTGYLYANGSSAVTASTSIPTSALSGTISLTSQVTGTLPVANGGTGVTASSGASSVVLRDSNANITTNGLFEGYTNQAAGTAVTLTASSTPNWVITGSGGQTITLPNATTLSVGAQFTFNNNQTSGTITVNNASSTLVVSVASGAFATVTLLSNGSSAGTWDVHFNAPSNVLWSTNTFQYPGTITQATWNGVGIGTYYGGTGLTGATPFTSGGAVYASSASALTTGTLPVGSGGTGATTLTGYVYGNGTSAMTASTTIPFSAISGTVSTTNSLTVNSSGSGGASPQTFNGSSAVTISYNTVGASPLAGSTSLTTVGTITTGTWNAGSVTTSGSFVAGSSTYGPTSANVAGSITPGYSSAVGTSTIYSGTGTPSFSAPSGSLYLSYSGTGGGTVYYNSSTAGTSGTSWAAFGGSVQEQYAIFTASTTWTCPAGVTKVYALVVGGGGGGDGLDETNGGVGGQAYGYYTVSPGTGYTITVGTGGIGNNTGNGASGNTSSFASFCSATGGGGANGGDGTNGSGSSGNLRNSNAGTILQNAFAQFTGNTTYTNNVTGHTAAFVWSNTLSDSWTGIAQLVCPGAGGYGFYNNGIGGVGGVVALWWVG